MAHLSSGYKYVQERDVQHDTGGAAKLLRIWWRK